LWKELVCEKDGVPLKVNSVQLAFTGLETAESGQKFIDEFLKSAESKRLRGTKDLNLYQSGKSGEGTGRANVDASGDDDNSFRCVRCGACISLPDIDGQPAEESRARLEKLKIEHADFHFAQDLVRITPSNSGFDKGHPPRKKRKPPKESENITRYLIRK
jgi:DNA polymerase eta